MWHRGRYDMNFDNMWAKNCMGKYFTRKYYTDYETKNSTSKY